MNLPLYTWQLISIITLSAFHNNCIADDKIGGKLLSVDSEFASSLSASQTRPSVTTLSDALSTAYENSPLILAERAQVRAVDEGVSQAVGGWRPTVTVSGYDGIIHQTTKINFSTSVCSPALLDSSANLSPQRYGVSVSQTLYGAQIAAQTDKALALVRSEQAHLADTEATVFLTVISDYLGVVTAQRVLELNRKYVQRLDGQIDLTKGRRRSGELTGTDVLESETYRAQASAGLYAAEQNLTSTRAAYQHDVGEAPISLIMPEPPLLLLPKSVDSAVNQAISSDPAVRQSRYALVAANENVRTIEAQLLPTLSLQGTVQRQSETAQQRTTVDSEQLLVELSMPIYEGGIIYGQARAAKDQVTQQSNQLVDAERSVAQSVRQAWAAVATDTETVRAQVNEIEIAEKTLKKIQDEALLGSRGIFDILNFEQILFQARVILVQTEFDLLLNQFTLLRLIGALNPLDLMLPVKVYNSERHLQNIRGKWIGLDPLEEDKP